MKIIKNNLLFFSIILFLSLLPLAIQDSPRLINIISLAFIWSIVASSWDLSMGYARIFSFGHIAFFVIGCYASILTVIHLGVPPSIGILLGGLIASGIGVTIALPCLRLSGIYVAVVTYGIHLIIPSFLTWQRELTGGATGLFGFTPLVLGQYAFSPSNPITSYYFIFGLFTLLIYALYRIIKSPIGLALMCLRDSQSFGESIGINVYKYKVIAFGISAFMAGLMGGIYTSFYDAVTPALLNVDTFLMVLIMVMLGGLGKFPGSVFGAFAITFAVEMLRPAGLARFVILGAIVIVVMIIMPKGLIGVGGYIKNYIQRYIRQSKKGESNDRSKNSG